MKSLNSLKLKVKAKGPDILVVVGIAGIITSTIMACRATKKASDILDEHKETMDQIKQDFEEQGEEIERESGTTLKKETTKVFVHTGVELVKAYGPAVVLGTLSIGSVLESHHILKKRNIALAAAYSGLDKAYKKYRERVIDKLGEVADREFRYGAKQEKVEYTEVDENGKEKKKKETIEVVDADFNEASPYARIFDEFSPKWEDDPEYNRMFLISTQNYANDYLKAHGYLFLNQVYEWLGFKKTKAGQQVGWVYDPKGGEGDNFVDFGIRTIYKRAVAGDISDKMFINGLEPSTILDFNVDGEIMSTAFDIAI